MKKSHSFFAVLVTALLSVGACKSRRQAEVAGVWVAQADGLSELPEGDVVVVTPRAKIESLPDSKHIQLSIAREVPWAEVRELRKRIMAEGKVPHLVVASGRKVGSIELYEELSETGTISVFVSVGGKLCVAPPGSIEAKCVQRKDERHVDRSFTRELVREAVRAYQLYDVEIDVPPDLEWADLVRAVDGARTCCYEDKVRVTLK